MRILQGGYIYYIEKLALRNFLNGYLMKSWWQLDAERVEKTYNDLKEDMLITTTTGGG